MEFSFRAAESLLLYNTTTFEYDNQGILLVEKSKLYFNPFEIYYFYDAQGRKSRTEQIFNNNEENQEVAGDRFKILSEYEYDEKGLLTRHSISTSIIELNNKVKELPGKIRLKRKYTYYQNT